MANRHCSTTVGTEVIFETHCCSTMNSDHFNARVTYVMWYEECLWNVSVLQRLHLFSLVLRHVCFVLKRQFTILLEQALLF
jgi:hypothetical protein